MELGWMTGIGTLLLMIAYGALCLWAYSPKQRQRFEQAAQLPFLPDPVVPPYRARGHNHD
jgi:cytochrome c oxidase cbb3-type subunit 4